MTTMNDLIMKLARDFNSYSELVALNRAQLKEGRTEESTLQWNRGYMNCTKEYLEQLAEAVGGVSLIWECGTHTFGFDDWARQLDYTTVQVVFEPEKEA